MTEPQKKLELRKRAEALACENSVLSQINLTSISLENMKRSLHELQVHQIELEMQNEELRRVQSELETARARYFDLYDLAPVGYCIISEQGLILESNLTAATLLGAGRSDLNRQPFSRLIFKEDQDIYYLHNKKLFETSEPCQCELRLIKKDRSPLWVRIDAMIVWDDDGVPLCRAALSDITKHKQAEEKEIELQDQLEQAQKMESVGRLAGNVAHDFNNMLGVILGYVEMALEQVDPIQKETLHSDLSEIKRVTVLSSDLTRQLMAVALKQQTGSPKVLSLNETVDSMLTMLTQIIGAGIDLTWMPGKSMWPIRMDPSQARQILANLCLNARDAIGVTGTVAIETGNSTFDPLYCSSHPGFKTGEYVKLSVRDNGCGMDQEIKGRIFKPFFTTKEQRQGSGLGLTMVSSSVKQNNGFISVYSELGRGSTFEIYLPRYQEGAIVG